MTASANVRVPKPIRGSAGPGRRRAGVAILERLSRATASERQIRRKRSAVAVQLVIAVALGLAAWTLVADVIDASALFPSVRVTADRFVQLGREGRLGTDVYASLARIFVGFAVGSVIGIIVGLLSAATALAAAVDPFVHFFRFIPPIVWFGPALLIFGSGETSKVVLIVYSTFFVVAINTQAGARRVPRDAIRAARSFGAGPVRVFLRVVLPSSIGYIFVGMRIAMGSSFMTIVVAEMLGANEGIGYLITLGGVSVDTSTVFVGVILLGVCGLLADFALSRVVNRFGARYLMTVM
jgi:NitT/TauT family transport system permease protein